MENLMKEKRGITLIALIVTIIVLLILAGVTIATLTGDNGLLTKAGESKNTSEKGEIEEQIKLAYNDWKLRKETGETVDLQNTVQTTLNKMYDNVAVNKQGKAISINVKGYEFTLVDDGTMEEGKLAYLDIADGNIDLYSNGYKQYTGNLQNLNRNSATAYTGRYIITGTTTENVVRICDEGTFDITIKDLNIDMSTKSGGCPFNANAGNKTTGCNVNLILESSNHLTGNGNGLRFAGALANVENVTNGSTLTIEGNGSLEAKGGNLKAGIGGGNTSNIIINSGTITASSVNSACGIGSDVNCNSNNIIINGGNITATGGSWSPAIGAYNYIDNLLINGGTITASGYYSIGGRDGGKITIKGGDICAKTIGNRIQNILIEGGTINTSATNYSGKAGICCKEGGNIKITGGNIISRGININIATYSGADLTSYIPKDETNNLYETQIKLQNVGEDKKVTKLTTSDGIEYGIKDMYTLENGMLYLYLPTGTRTITITTEDGKTYSGTVETKETPEEVILNETN